MIGNSLTIFLFLTVIAFLKSGEPAGAKRKGKSRFDGMFAGGALKSRIDRSASDGCFSADSSLVPTWISISG